MARYVVTVRHEYAVLVRARDAEHAARMAEATERADRGRTVEVLAVEKV